MPIELDISAFEAGPKPSEIIPEGILRKGEIVGVRLPGSHRVEEFFRNQIDVEIGDLVVVNTANGHELGRVVNMVRYGWRENTGGRKVLKKALPEDAAHNERRTQREADFFKIALEQLAEMKLDDVMKPVTLEINYDGAGARLYFAAEERVDFRDLVRVLGHRFHMRVEMRQVGPRDRAALAGGYGLCGRELCCSSWLGGFPAVSVKQAKNQNLALDQSKITGQCGRLLCCLSYEDEQYKQLNKTLPKRGFKFVLDGMNYMVISTNPLLRKVLVESAERKAHLIDAEAFDAVIMKQGVKLISQPNYLVGEAKTAAQARAASEVFPPEGTAADAAHHHQHAPVQDVTDMEDDDVAAEHHDKSAEHRGPAPAQVEFQSPGTVRDDEREDQGGESGQPVRNQSHGQPRQNRDIRQGQSRDGGNRPQGQGGQSQPGQGQPGQNRGRRRGRGRGRGGNRGPGGSGGPQQ